MNFCREPQWLPFRIGQGHLERQINWQIDWGQPLETAPVYERLPTGARENATLLQEAKDCLRETLATGDMPAKVALKQVMECGFSKGTVLRARRELEVRSYREGFGPFGWWCWSIRKAGDDLPPGDPKDDANSGNGETPDIRAAAKAGGPGRLREKQPAPADEFGGASFERLFRALFVESLNHNAEQEEAAELANGKPESNGKPAKDGGRKPR
jgi:hypothetical protein